jgi:hypothetical protein
VGAVDLRNLIEFPPLAMVRAARELSDHDWCVLAELVGLPVSDLVAEVSFVALADRVPDEADVGPEWKAEAGRAWGPVKVDVGWSKKELDRPVDDRDPAIGLEVHMEDDRRLVSTVREQDASKLEWL